MIKRLLIGSIILLGTVVVLYFYLPQPQQAAYQQQQASTGTVTIGGPFTLVDTEGRTVSEDILRGHYSLVYFGFTYCPDICPLTLQTISRALDDAGPAGESVLPVLISLDPERDTPEALGAYVANFHPRLVGLTGSLDQVKGAADAYKVYFEKSYMKDAEGNATENYLVDHTGYTYLMGPDGRYVDHFDKVATPSQMTGRIRQSLSGG